VTNQRKEVSSLSIAVTGSGGAGVMTAGGFLLEAAAKAGWYGLQTRSVGPQIRGGEAAALLRLSTQPAEVHADAFDILFVVDWLNFDRFAAEIELHKDTIVIADPASGEVADAVTASGARVIEMPAKEILEAIAGGRPNMLALGTVAGIIGLPMDTIFDLIEEQLGSKGEQAVSSGKLTVEAGYKFAETLEGAPRLAKPTPAAAGRWLITGNEAAGLGAVRGGIRFAAAYPITPATEILEWLSSALAKVGGALVQAEDELASINMAIGASYGGVPALTATSGPGLALMSEAIGLAIASEVPVVVIDVMRGGPSTGIPTKSEQSDLNIAVYGLHGDAPHVVVGALSIADCLFTTQWAVHLAEAMQVPTIVLSDQFIGQAKAVIDRPAEIAFLGRRQRAENISGAYLRYAVTASGISPMAIPGTPGGQYTADGLEHSPRGAPSTRAEDHLAQLDKRQHKLDAFDFGNNWADIDGEGDLAVVTWGSSTAAAREAVELARRGGRAVKLIALRLIVPCQPEAMRAALAGVAKVLVVEQTHSGQFMGFLRAHYDLPREVRGFHHPGPFNIRPTEILNRIEEWS
jgi:2-oxoglutarate ferredoxin oxidoreductase subunit alpha